MGKLNLVAYIKILKNSLIYNVQVKSPPKSPDLNPIEWVWADLKRFVRKKFCTNEKDEKCYTRFSKTVDATILWQLYKSFKKSKKT